jgi:hypothetical protein
MTITISSSTTTTAAIIITTSNTTSFFMFPLIIMTITITTTVIIATSQCFQKFFKVISVIVTYALLIPIDDVTVVFNTIIYHIITISF